MTSKPPHFLKWIGVKPYSDLKLVYFFEWIDTYIFSMMFEVYTSEEYRQTKKWVDKLYGKEVNKKEWLNGK